MTRKTAQEILGSIKNEVARLSPQLRTDFSRGPLFDIGARAVAVPLADGSVDVDRAARLSTLDWATVATEDEQRAATNAFAVQTPARRSSRGVVLMCTGQAPTGSATKTARAGAQVATGQINGTPLVFTITETRSLTASNAGTYYNASNRRYELPVEIVCNRSGDIGDVPEFAINRILSGANDFETCYNDTELRAGFAAQSAAQLYARLQAKLRGIDSLSTAALISSALELDGDRIDDVALVFSTQYPVLFRRLPDGPGIDVIISGPSVAASTARSFTAAAGQQLFLLSDVGAPVLSLTSVEVNGLIDSTATLGVDTSAQTQGSNRANDAAVELSAPATVGDQILITFTYDAVIRDVGARLGSTTSKGMFSVDIVVRRPRQLEVGAQLSISVTPGSVPSAVLSDALAAANSYLRSGAEGNRLGKIGGVRTARELSAYVLARISGCSRCAVVSMSADGVDSPAYVDVPGDSIVRLGTVTVR